MKAEELRIGNYLLETKQVDYDEPENDYYPDRVIRVGKHLFQFEDEDIKPIPLTEEWLVKFGFTNDNYAEYKKDVYTLDCEYTDKGVFNFVINEECCLNTDIKHVHQLQNLYFALTNEELTIN